MPKHLGCISLFIHEEHVIHAAYAQDRIPEAGRDTGSQQSRDHRIRTTADRVFTLADIGALGVARGGIQSVHARTSDFTAILPRTCGAISERGSEISTPPSSTATRGMP